MSRVDPNNRHNGISETTTRVYDGSGYLLSVTAPLAGATTSFTYDAYGRVRTVTDSEGYVLTYDYDALNRTTKVTYPDGTFDQTIYFRLDPEWKRDRAGRWTHLIHDNARRLVRVDDPASRSVSYDWCVCGALHAIKDGEGRTTRFAYDLAKHLIQKTYDDATAVQYTYDAFRGLKTSRIDAQGQRTNYSYNLDDTLHEQSYTNGAGLPLSPFTPSVTFSYDTKYSRLSSLVDGTGTTSFAYNAIGTGTLGAGQLSTVDGPLASDTIAYGYDEIGTRLSTAIDGTASTATIDSLGRATSVVNPLGTFDYSYVNTTDRLAQVDLPNGQTTEYAYYGNAAAAGTGNGDQRLQTIWHKLPGGATLSKHELGYDVAGNINSWQRTVESDPTTGDAIDYNAVDELLSVSRKAVSSGATQKQYGYGYDRAGNRTVEQQDSAISSATYNGVNQLKTRDGAGPMVIEGTVDEPSTVTVGGQPAIVDGSNKFRRTVNVSPGTQNIEIKATDANGNVTTKQAAVTVTAGSASQSFTYNPDGDLTADGLRTYEWDAEHRLVAINYVGTSPAERTEFTYNGLSQRVKMVEKMGGSVVTERVFVWSPGDAQPSEERDGSNVVVKRFYPQGVRIGSTSYYYTRDHLGSVRELADSSGNVRARYDYDPYGRRSANLVTVNPIEADFGFTGHFWHAKSGLSATLYRFYDAESGRWLSRDPIGEEGGLNLYSYVNNTPANFVDLSGEAPIDVYSTPAWGLGGPLGNHVYAYDPVSNTSADMNGSSGHPFGQPADRWPDDSKKATIEIPQCKTGADAIKKIQEEIYNHEQKRAWCPFLNDCHNALENAIQRLGGDYPKGITPRFDPPPSRTAPPRIVPSRNANPRTPGKL